MNRRLTLVDEFLSGSLNLEVLQGNAIVLLGLLLLLVDRRSDQGLLTFAGGLSCGNDSEHFFVVGIRTVSWLGSLITILGGWLLFLSFEVGESLVGLLDFDSGRLGSLIRLVVVDVGVLQIRL